MKFIFIIEENTIHKKQAMSARTSSIMYEILYSTYNIPRLLINVIRYGINGYFSYIDDILIVNSLTNTNVKKKF
jgi:hypothetical protein